LVDWLQQLDQPGNGDDLPKQNRHQPFQQVDLGPRNVAAQLLNVPRDITTQTEIALGSRRRCRGFVKLELRDQGLVTRARGR